MPLLTVDAQAALAGRIGTSSKAQMRTIASRTAPVAKARKRSSPCAELLSSSGNFLVEKMGQRPPFKLVRDTRPLWDADEDESDKPVPEFLAQLLQRGVIQGDAGMLLGKLPSASVDLFFMSPPYADARAYSRIHPDRYVEWFLPFARLMYDAAKPTGNLIINIKNRVASRGPLRGQRHPYVYELVLALQNMGWRWIETYIWAKPNAVPGKFGPRTKDSFEYVYHFARTSKPYFDLQSIRVPYKAAAAEIARRKQDTLGRRSTEAGFGRDRTKTYLLGGADPGNVVSVSQTYNQHRGVAHTAAMPEGLAEFFIKAACPQEGVVIDPFAGGATTVVVARRLGRMAGGFEIHERFVTEALRRIAEDLATDTPGQFLTSLVG